METKYECFSVLKVNCRPGMAEKARGMSMKPWQAAHAPM